MIGKLGRNLILGAGFITAAACSSLTPESSSTAHAVTQLFELQSAKRRPVMGRPAGVYLNSLRADPANEEVLLVNVNASSFDNRRSAMAIALPDGTSETFHARDSSELTEGVVGWVGYKPSHWKANHATDPSEIDFDPRYYMSVIRVGDQFAGNFLVAGQRYKLTHIEADMHALIKVDESKLPPEHLPGINDEVAESLPEMIKHEPKTLHSVIRLLFVSTVQSRAEHPNYRAELMLGLQDVNQVAKNSHVAITYELAGIFDSAIDEEGKSFGDLLNEVQYSSPEVTAKRVALNADLVSMYVANSSLCGAGKPSSNKSQGYSAINCISSLAHEIGHNFGMVHGWNGTSTDYVHGYKNMPNEEADRFRTQMAYDCSPACPRVPFYSNPRLTYRGQPLGTVAHHDVARAMNERRESIENFYPPFERVQVMLFSQKNFQGDSCDLLMTQGGVANVSSQCRNHQVRSFRVSGYKPGNKFCLYDESGGRHICYGIGVGDARALPVADIDERKAPPEFSVSYKGGVLNGAVADVLYGNEAIQLFAAADFTQPLCSLALNYEEYVIAQSPGCPDDAGGKARSARIFNQVLPDGNLANRQWCFYNSDHSRTLCLEGKYWGKFGIANFDSVRGIPPVLVRTQRGGYMNGSVHRVKLEPVYGQ